jgi:hypothetical protein
LADLGQRLANVEARLERLERAGASTVAVGGEAADALEAMEAAESTDGKQRRVRWTAEDDAALRRIAADGGTQADAMRELQRSSGTINAKWKSLGLPVQPRKGRKRQARTA